MESDIRPRRRIPLYLLRVRGANEYAKDGINSVVCRTGKSEEYAFAIRKLKSNPELLKRFSDNCRDSAFDFTDGEVRKIMRPVYERAILSCVKGK